MRSEQFTSAFTSTVVRVREEGGRKWHTSMGRVNSRGTHVVRA